MLLLSFPTCVHEINASLICLFIGLESSQIVVVNCSTLENSFISLCLQGHCHFSKMMVGCCWKRYFWGGPKNPSSSKNHSHCFLEIWIFNYDFCLSSRHLKEHRGLRLWRLRGQWSLAWCQIVKCEKYWKIHWPLCKNSLHSKLNKHLSRQ